MQPKASKPRLKFLDISKGILIISVVIGHTHLDWTQIIYWFHLPSFFIISGILHKQPAREDIKPFIRKKMVNLLLPYLAFGVSVIIIMTIGRWLLENVNPVKGFAIEIARLLYGGRMLYWTMGPFWFIPTLFLTIAAFTLIRSVSAKNSNTFFLLIASFLIGISVGKLEKYPIPWNANVVFFSMFYYGIGFLSKDLVLKFYRSSYRTLITVCLFVICGILIYLDLKDYYALAMDMKISLYSSKVLAIVYPIIFTTLILGLSSELEKIKLGSALEFIGINSLIIMYLHYPINNAIISVIGKEYSPILFVVIGVVFPLVIGKMLERNNFTRKVFLGRPTPKRNSSIIKKVQVEI